MEVTLSEAATINLGFAFRGKIEPSEEGSYRVLQIRDITNGNMQNHQSLVSVMVQPGFEKFVLRTDDIIMPVRGGEYSAVLFEESEEVVIAPSHLFIIRCKPGVLPAYLCWYLNQPKIRYELEAFGTGSSIQMINKEALSRLGVKIPEMQVQQKISGIQKLWLEQRNLYDQLINNGDQLTQELCADIAAKIIQ